MSTQRFTPEFKVLVHSDQGTQYGSEDWTRFCQATTRSEHESTRQLLGQRGR